MLVEIVEEVGDKTVNLGPWKSSGRVKGGENCSPFVSHALSAECSRGQMTNNFNKWTQESREIN